MVGGIGVLLLLALISTGLTTYGFEKVFTTSVQRLRDQGMPLEEIRRRVEATPFPVT